MRIKVTAREHIRTLEQFRKSEIIPKLPESTQLDLERIMANLRCYMNLYIIQKKLDDGTETKNANITIIPVITYKNKQYSVFFTQWNYNRIGLELREHKKEIHFWSEPIYIKYPEQTNEKEIVINEDKFPGITETLVMAGLLDQPHRKIKYHYSYYPVCHLTVNGHKIRYYQQNDERVIPIKEKTLQSWSAKNRNCF